MGQGVVQFQVGLADVAGVAHGDGLLCQPQFFADAVRLRRFGHEGDGRMFDRAAIGTEHRAAVNGLWRWD